MARRQLDQQRNKQVLQQLGLILVAVAILVFIIIFVASGIQEYRECSAQANLEEVISDLKTLAARAHQFYPLPITMGGGNKSFVGFVEFAIKRGWLPSLAGHSGWYSIVFCETDREVRLQGTTGNAQVELYVRTNADDDSLVVVSR